MTTDPTPMRTYNAHFTGAFVAECPVCHAVCAGWDDDDLDDNGALLCYHDSLSTVDHDGVTS